MIANSGLEYQIKRERIDFGEVVLEIDSLADIDATIDRLFELYTAEGKTELFEEMCPYFGTLWPAGRVLAQFLSENPLPMERRVLEVGCGLAVPSLYLSKAFKRAEVLGDDIVLAATDLHPDVPQFLERNRELNSVDRPSFLTLDWRDETAVEPTWELILASDVLYDKTQPATLLKFLKKALAPGGRVLIADPGRPYLGGFFDDARQQGFRVKTSGLFGVLIGELTRDMLS